jgi:hypothetical protein
LLGVGVAPKESVAVWLGEAVRELLREMDIVREADGEASDREASTGANALP